MDQKNINALYLFAHWYDNLAYYSSATDAVSEYLDKQESYTYIQE